MYISASRIEIGIALKALVMVQKHLFCMIESLLVGVFDFLISFGVCHIVEP